MAEKDVKDTTETPAEEAYVPQGRRRSLAGEFFDYLMDNKKWWMIPIVAVVLFLCLILVFSGSPVMPLIYTLF